VQERPRHLGREGKGEGSCGKKVEVSPRRESIEEKAKRRFKNGERIISGDRGGGDGVRGKRIVCGESGKKDGRRERFQSPRKKEWKLRMYIHPGGKKRSGGQEVGSIGESEKRRETESWLTYSCTT